MKIQRMLARAKVSALPGPWRSLVAVRGAWPFVEISGRIVASSSEHAGQLNAHRIGISKVHLLQVFSSMVPGQTWPTHFLQLMLSR
jgi:hypothetical protein